MEQRVRHSLFCQKSRSVLVIFLKQFQIKIPMSFQNEFCLVVFLWLERGTSLGLGNKKIEFFHIFHVI